MSASAPTHAPLPDLPTMDRGRSTRREHLAALQPSQPSERNSFSFSSAASRALAASRRRRSQSPGKQRDEARQSDAAVQSRARRASVAGTPRPRRYSYTQPYLPTAPSAEKATEREAAWIETSVDATLGPDEPAHNFRKSLPKDFEHKTVEELRMTEEANKERYWRRWGPYAPERQWGTVREDYSPDGNAWDYFPHDHARSRAYRWGVEDGLAGVSDNRGRLAITLALWNGKDNILKERAYGLSNLEGNHGEDVKELYYYLDNVPSHSYMKYLYKYPQRAFPYEELIRENGNRSREVAEFEITDTDAFDDDRYFDVFVEYAKDADEENAMSMRVTVFNRGPDPADLHIMPQAAFRNTWAWPAHEPEDKPSLHRAAEGAVQLDHPTLGRYFWYVHSSPAPCEPWDGKSEPKLVTDETVEPELLFTENDTNYARLYNGENRHIYSKDAFHDYLIPSHRPDGADCNAQYVNPDEKGTKVGAHYFFKQIPPKGGCATLRLKLTPRTLETDKSIDDDEAFDATLDARRLEADEFYDRLSAKAVLGDRGNITRSLLAGMLWSKQFYYFVQREWAEGDPGQPAPPPHRAGDRNSSWTNLYMLDIISMPDKWEYVYSCLWDLAFHTVPLALVDPGFAKTQLDIYTREWYMKPDGAMPAYEWNFSDVNPPVHAWAALRVYRIEEKVYGTRDIDFLERMFQKLLINFTWWVNRKDESGMNVFEGGFLGLDNIGPFNRSEPIPGGGTLRQSDGTAWMAFYALTMLSIALELARSNPNYEDIASKFFEHFILISDALTYPGPDNKGLTLWDEDEGFYYDAIQLGSTPAAGYKRVNVRSLVGLVPLFSVLTIEPSALEQFPSFAKRFSWFVENRPELSERNMANMRIAGQGDKRLLALVSRERLERILRRMLDETEFLSEHGIRSLSKYHLEHPWQVWIDGQPFGVEYWPAESKSGMFGGNSNWRGPIWVAMNFLIIESLFKFHAYYGSSFTIELPTGSGKWLNLAEAALELERRLTSLFERDAMGRRPLNGGSEKLDFDPHFRHLFAVNEYFDGDTGRGLGASHQTGWTGLVAYSILNRSLGLTLPKQQTQDPEAPPGTQKRPASPPPF